MTCWLTLEVGKRYLELDVDDLLEETDDWMMTSSNIAYHFIPFCNKLSNSYQYGVSNICGLSWSVLITFTHDYNSINVLPNLGVVIKGPVIFFISTSPNFTSFLPFEIKN